MNTNGTNRSQIWLIAVALTLAIAATYYAAPTHDFISYGDRQYVTHSEPTQQGFTLDGIKWAFTDVSTGDWHPLTRLSHMADFALFGANAGGHHTVNVLIHIANSILLLLALNRMTGALWRSAFVAGLFALHPLHVESVAWISERKDLLSTFFWIAAMYAYAAYAERVSVVRYVFVALLMALGLMATPMVMTLPAALLLLDVWPLKRLTVPIGATRDFAKCLGKLVFEKIPLFVLGIGAAVLALALRQDTLNPFEQLSATVRAQNALAAYGTYLKLTFSPSGLAIFYPHPLDTLEASAWITGAVLITVCSLASFVLIKRTPYVFVGWWWFVGTLVPVIGIVQVGLQGWADRYTYLPHIGLFVGLVWGLSDLLAKREVPKKVVGAAMAIVLIALGFLSAQQHAHWKDTMTVFDRALLVTVENKPSHLILGVAVAERGEYAKAASHFLRAIPDVDDARWCDGMPEGHFALGVLAERKQNWEEAAKQYAKAVELDPQFSEAQKNLARASTQLNKNSAHN